MTQSLTDRAISAHNAQVAKIDADRRTREDHALNQAAREAFSILEISKDADNFNLVRTGPSQCTLTIDNLAFTIDARLSHPLTLQLGYTTHTIRSLVDLGNTLAIHRDRET